MTTRALEELDGGLGSCQPVTPRLADSSSWPHGPQELEAEGSPAGGGDARPKKTEKGPVAKVAPGPSKERLKAGAAPRSPARKKAQVAPPQPPPLPPPALSEELPWGDLSLNKCLVLASLVALLGSAFQLCRDAVAGEAGAPTPAPEPWVPPSSSPKKPAPHLPKPVAWAPPSVPPAPQAEAEERPEVPAAAARKDEGEPGEAAGEKRAPLAHGGPKERPRKESPRKEKSRKEERPRKEEKPRRAEKPRAAREPPGALPRRWEAREGGRRPWVQESRDPEHRKRPAWASLRRPNEEDRPPGRQKHRAGKGRD